MFYIIVLLFGNIIIRYRIRSRIRIPIATFGYLTPLFLCSAIVYARKRGAITERLITNACDTVGDGYARKRGAKKERRITNACDTVGDGYARKL